MKTGFKGSSVVIQTPASPKVKQTCSCVLHGRLPRKKGILLVFGLGLGLLCVPWQHKPNPFHNRHGCFYHFPGYIGSKSLANVGTRVHVHAFVLPGVSGMESLVFRRKCLGVGSCVQAPTTNDRGVAVLEVSKGLEDDALTQAWQMLGKSSWV